MFVSQLNVHPMIGDSRLFSLIQINPMYMHIIIESHNLFFIFLHEYLLSNVVTCGLCVIVMSSRVYQA